MKVILRQDIDNLGRLGEIVNVKNGYARNYLIPRSYVYLATPGAMKALEAEKKNSVRRHEKERVLAEELASQLSELQVTVAVKVGEEGRLYGSVTPQMIAQELALRGFNIDKRAVIIEEAIKSLGIFDVKVKLHSEVFANVKAWVISEE
ncbi:MAG: large subunit ribosomal protein [Bacteroidota bacterium]|nr:large subunit ribosomal protein [Bacteroidota bacterium]